MKPVLVTGATGVVGATGRHLAELLLKRGAPVRAMVRKDDERSQKLAEAGAEIVKGDFLDEDAVRSAMQGVDVAYFCPPVFEVLLQATTVFAHCAREASVKRVINRVSVDAAFFKKLSPFENLAYAARLYGMDPKSARTEAISILARLGIGEKRLGRPLEQMSRGMQQKVAIARALLTSPTLLLLDEPTTGLDPRSKLDVQTFIEELRDTHDATIVLTTHDLAEADRLCDRIGIINDGRIVVEDTPEALRAKVAAEHGQEPTMESVFMTYTGRSLDDDINENENEDDDE